jgi:glutamate formiminotransferase/formiminotetrahydrofolate cyclodeaminase
MKRQGTMVANLSAHKSGWDERWKEFSDWAEKGQKIKNELLFLVDEDTQSFNKIMDAFSMPKANEEQKQLRSQAIQEATKYAIEVPYKTMRKAFEAFELCNAMVDTGNPNSVSDAGVGALCVRSAVMGAYLNVKINAASLKDKGFVNDILQKAEDLLTETKKAEEMILSKIMDKL